MVAAGHEASEQGDSFVATFDVATGAEQCLEKLPGPVVKGGLAVNHDGQVFVSLEDGRLLAFATE